MNQAPISTREELAGAQQHNGAWPVAEDDAQDTEPVSSQGFLHSKRQVLQVVSWTFQLDKRKKIQ